MGILKLTLFILAGLSIVTASCIFDSAEDTYGIDGYVRDAGGQPVEGALIRKTGGESGSTYTRSTGYYWIPVSRRSNEVALIAVKSGWAFCPGRREFADFGERYHDQDFTGFYGGEVVIEGYVLDSGGSPVEGVKVVNREPGIFLGLTSVTNYMGYYRFGNIVAGYTYRFAPTRPGCVFNPSERTYAFPARDYLHQNFTISCVGSFGIAGRVTDPDGEPVGGVTLLITPDNVTAVTDEDGYYSRDGLAPSAGTKVTPSKEGCVFDPESAGIPTPFGNISGVDFTAWCGETHTLSGYIRMQGNPLPDLPVTIEGGRYVHSGQDRTDETGRYEFSKLHAGYDYTIKPPRIGYATAPESIVIQDLGGDHHDLDFELFDEHVYVLVSGHVRDKNGNPLEGMEVKFQLRPPLVVGSGAVAVDAPADCLWETTTDADGYYSINVPDGWGIRMYMVQAGCLFIPQFLDYVPGREADNLDFVAYCGDGYTLSGYVMDTDGSGARNVPVVAICGFFYRETAYTDTTGYYEFTNRPSDLEITVRPSSGYSIPYEGCIFCPSERVYGSIEHDYADQNFTLSCPGP